MSCRVALVLMASLAVVGHAAAAVVYRADTDPTTEHRRDLAFRATRIQDRTEWDAPVMEQEFWPSHTVFRLDCHCGGIARIVPYTIAVARDGAATIVSQGIDPDADRAAISAFNAISLAEGVVLTQDNAKAYIDFFLNAYLTDDGLFIPNERIVKVVLKLENASDESDTLARALGHNQPAALVTGVEANHISAETFEWLWWCGSVDRHQVVVSNGGQVNYQMTRYGEQRSRKHTRAANNALNRSQSGVTTLAHTGKRRAAGRAG